MRDFVAHVRQHLSRRDVPEDRFDEIVEELAAELESRYTTLVEQGASDEEAWSAAVAQVPSWSSFARDLASATGAPPPQEQRSSRLRMSIGFDRWLNDLKLAIRVLRKDRGFTLTALVTLTICLGGHAAIVAGVNGVLFHPLRIPEADRVLLMANQYPAVEKRWGTTSATPDYDDRLRHVTVMEGQALYNYSGVTLEIAGVPTRALGIVGTPSLLRLLRARPAHGRLFVDSEATPGNDQSIILSDRLFRELYNGDPAAVGRTLRVSGRELTIVGVLPRDFTFGGPDIRFWTPLALTERQRSDDARHSNGWLSIGRLKPGATIDHVRAQLKALDAVNLERTSPKLKPILINTGFYSSVEPLANVVVRDVQGPLSMLWGASIVVLVIGLGNLGNLAFARARTRLSELGTRLAIGAGRFDVIRQQLVEGLLIGGLGAGAAIALGVSILSTLRRRELVTNTAIQIDLTVVGITIGLGIAAGAIVGLVSASPLFTMRLSSILHDGTRSRTGGRAVRATRRTLVVAQMACSFMLLVGAGLLWVSVRNLLNVKYGFALDNVITAGVNLPQPRYAADEDARSLIDRSLDSIRRLPGVVSAGATTVVPLRGFYQSGVIIAEGYVPKPGEPAVATVRATVTPGYFEAAGTALVRGRYFDDREMAESTRSVIVDESLARRFWRDEDPIGRRVFRPANAKELESTGPDTPWLTVVGVVRDAQLRGPLVTDYGTNGTVYFPYAATAPRDFGYVIRTAGDPTAVVGEIRSALAQIDRELPLFDIRTMSERTQLALLSRTSTMQLATLFAAVALFLSAIGLYGVLAYLVTQRSREIGVRLAVGSAPREIIALVVREGLGLALGGVVLGVIGALMLGRLIVSQLYGIAPADPWVMLLMTIMLTAIAALACFVPARRAANVDVMKILSAP
ncbi:MAG TPA: ABC transporter permease [Vicinamibacterales bacterium]|nr:ABC transporter permease [Vicinamibacterales bacterium]